MEIPPKPSASRPPTSEHAQAQKAGHDTTPIGVLVIDDEPSVRGLLREALEGKGYAVWIAEDGGQGLETYRQQHARIDVVLLDVRMPGLDGPATLAELHKIDAALQACFLTAHAGGYSEEHLLEAGAARVLQKPFGVAAVLALVRDLAELRRTQSA